MDWVARMHAAIDYIEERLTEEIDYGEIARAACCSPHHFQRMFSFLTDVSLSEYIRRRRLTLAAFELQSGSAAKVVDLASKYGYDSPEAFARAFQHVHGTTPTAARRTGATLKSFPRLAFRLTITGVTEMKYRIEAMPSFRVAGQRRRVATEEAYRVVPGLWAEAQENGVFGALWELRAAEHRLGGFLGICSGGGWGKNDEFDYTLAVVSNAPASEGMSEWTFPGASWAVFDVSSEPDGMRNAWKRMYAEWLPASIYELDDLPAIERYLPPEECRNELWIPVVKRT